MVKIYFDSFTLKITDTDAASPEGPTNEGSENVYLEPSAADMIRIMETHHHAGSEVVIRSQNIERVLSEVTKQFKLIQAAGGMVCTPEGSILMIYRRGKWDLPKGKLDDGEDLPTCAVREVTEETGIRNLVLGEKVTVTYHTYLEQGSKILKESHWYLMHSASDQKLVPQTDEDIEKCEWVLFNDVKTYLAETHPSIVDVLKKGIQLINKGV
jgi:8-oxo-dGTP pyrophosphatase MutT (NUDIX family)